MPKQRGITLKKISKDGVNLIKDFEGCYLKAYKDPVGVWTIGYGITNADKSITGVTIKSGLTISQTKADTWLETALNKKYLPLVLKYDSKYNWTQSELDALVSFAYNIGSIDQLTANGTRTKKCISEKILSYNKAGGRVLNGLTRRRKAEKDLFDKSTRLKSNEVVKRGQTNANTFVYEWLKNPPQIIVDGIIGKQTHGQCVRCVQIALNKDFNAGIAVDGVAGPKTKAALKPIKKGDERYLCLAVKILYQCNGKDANLKYSKTFGGGLEKVAGKTKITPSDILALI